jgi:uncharacterized membrane protein
VWLNNLLLFAICFLPFPTALLGEYPHNLLAVLCFGGNITIIALLQVLLYYTIAKNHLSKKYNQKSVLKNVRLAFILAPFLLIIALASTFINLWLTYVVYAIVPLFFILPMDKEIPIENMEQE